MDIGKEKEIITIEPIKSPIPERHPKPERIPEHEREPGQPKHKPTEEPVKV